MKTYNPTRLLSSILLLLFGVAGFAQVEMKTAITALGLTCPVVCPGDELTDLDLVTLNADHPLSKKYDWDKAGCISIPYDRDLLDLTFTSSDGSDDVDWVLIDGATLRSGEFDISTVLYQDHNGPVLGSRQPTILPTTLETTSLQGEGEYLVFYTAWGEYSDIVQLGFKAGFDWKSENEYCPSEKIELSPNPVANQLVITITDFSITSSYQYQIVNVNGVEYLPPRALVDRKVLVDVESFPSGYYVVSILNGDESIFSERFLKI